MKQKDLKKLALLGLASGLCASLVSAKTSSEILLSHFVPSSYFRQGIALADEPKEVKGAVSGKSSSAAADNYSSEDPNDGNLGYHLMTEEELLLELNDQGKKLYEGLDAEGKELARYVASQRCNGTNKCKGLNACQTEKNSCAGKGNCAGQGKCAFSDKNLAIKVVADKMANKRLKTLNP